MIAYPLYFSFDHCCQRHWLHEEKHNIPKTSFVPNTVEFPMFCKWKPHA